ncbi:unnamed protein product [Alopecurus aequalis]
MLCPSAAVSLRRPYLLLLLLFFLLHISIHRRSFGTSLASLLPSLSGYHNKRRGRGAMTSRRFVNLVVHHITGRPAPLSIHRINPANLFYQIGSTVPTQGSAELLATMEDVPLPPAQITFEWPSAPVHTMDFSAFSRNRDKIICMDSLGRAVLYDFASSCISSTILPNMPQKVRQPMSVAVGDNCLFFMSDEDPHFMALMDGRDPNSNYISKPNWCWASFQRPPFASRSCDKNKISAYTVVGKSQIWVSTVGAGTFTFDPESGAWNKAGDWALPFRGRVEYVPEHNLWFGFSHKDKHLCASDLTAVSTVRPPVPQKRWKDLVWPEDWKLVSTQLLPLGSGKLCIVRFFRISEEAEDFFEPDKINNFVVLAGVEAVYREGGLCFIKHKSERYSLGRDFANAL